MTDLDLDRIERDAKAAPQCEWHAVAQTEMVRVGDAYADNGWEERDLGYAIEAQEEAVDLRDKATAHHIANMDPPTTLALVAAFRRASAAYSESRMDQAIANNLARQELAKREAAEAEAARLRATIRAMRDKLHAYNRPSLKNALRVELRDMADAALEAK